MLKNVKIEKLPDGKVEVYLNLPANKKPDPGSKYFVGLLDLFSLQSVSIGHRANHIVKVHDINLDASISAEALGLGLRDLKKAVITFIVFGNSIDGKDEDIKGKITARSINFSVQRRDVKSAK